MPYPNDAEPTEVPEQAAEPAPEAPPEPEPDTTPEVLDAQQAPLYDRRSEHRGEAPATPPARVPGHVLAARMPAPGDLELAQLARLGLWLALSEGQGETERDRGAAAALRLYYVQQLGLPLWSVAELSLIRGKLVVSSNLLRTLAERAGYRVVKDPASDADSCTAILVRASTGEEIGRYTFTMEDAKRANLLRTGSPWHTFPARMLWHRAAKFVLDDYAPSVTLAVLTRDEMWHLRAEEAEPIGVDRYEYGPEPLSERDEDIPF